MNVCPKCNAQINGDFGMVVCPNCRAVSVIDLDGNVVLSDESPRQGAEPNPVTTSASQVPLPEESFVNFAPSEVVENSDLSTGQADDASDYVEPVPTPVNPLDVSHFAESPQSESGVITYDIVVTGIDTKEMRELFVENLEDSRLKLNIDQLLKQINNGKIKMLGLSAVKASTIVCRLKALPLEIRWIQHSIYE